jgi:hypothetical protein
MKEREREREGFITKNWLIVMQLASPTLKPAGWVNKVETQES